MMSVKILFKVVVLHQKPEWIVLIIDMLEYGMANSLLG